MTNQLALKEIYSYWSQKNISQKNIIKLNHFSSSNDPEVSELAATVLAIATVNPHRRNRFNNIYQNHVNLLKKGIELNLFYPHEEVETEEEYLEKYRQSLECKNDEEPSEDLAEDEDEFPF